MLSLKEDKCKNDPINTILLIRSFVNQLFPSIYLNLKQFIEKVFRIYSFEMFEPFQIPSKCLVQFLVHIWCNSQYMFGPIPSTCLVEIPSTCLVQFPVHVWFNSQYMFGLIPSTCLPFGPNSLYMFGLIPSTCLVQILSICLVQKNFEVLEK